MGSARSVTMSSPTDLDRLARQADEALAKADRHRGARGTRPASSKRLGQVLAVAVLALPLLVLQAHFAWVDQLAALLFPAHRVQQDQADLQAVLEAARMSVESAKARSGALPDALPSAAHAALVSYERRGDTYRLSMAGGQLLATMDAEGTVNFQRFGP